MDFLSHLLAFSVLLALILLWRRSSNNKKINSVPEPPGAWPIIGHLLLLGQKSPISKTLGAMADKLGPVFAVRLGVNRTVVFSSREAVKDCFTTNDKVFEKRPNSTAAVHLGYNYANFSFTEGPYWREVRKLVVMELLSARRLDALKLVREAEIESSIADLYELIRDGQGEEVVMSDWFERLTLNSITRLIAGKSDADSAAARSVRNIIKQLRTIFVVSDAIPFPPLRWLDLAGDIKFLKGIAGELSSITEGWIEEHVERRRIDAVDGDFIDVMLSAVDDKFLRFGHTRQTIIKATVSSLVLAGSDTTSVNLIWILSLLLNNPRVMRRARAEIDEKVGKERWVQESDIKNLTYLQAIAKETLRLFPAAPMTLRHEATEDCSVNDYHIQTGTHVLVNMWKLHRDPRVWEDPDEFVPERFLTKHAEVDFKGHHHEFIPFGSGRRVCPAIALAMQVTHLTIARLIQGFEFRTPEDEPVDLTEDVGITLLKATPLRVLVSPLLSPIMYQYSKRVID